MKENRKESKNRIKKNKKSHEGRQTVSEEENKDAKKSVDKRIQR